MIKVLPSKLGRFLSTIDVLWDKVAAHIVSGGILMPKYVITALLTDFIYSTRNWRRKKTVLSCLSKHY